jgi:hypothetical protein
MSRVRLDRSRLPPLLRRAAGLSDAADAALGHRAAGMAVLLASLIGAGLYSLSLGADANWDLHNYHLYNPYALLHGRYLRDIAPAGFQTFFHPLADLPFYLLVTDLPQRPRLIAVAMALPEGVSAFLLFLIARHLFTAGMRGRALAVAAAMAIGLTGAAVATTVGGTMNDYQVAPLVLAGLYAAMIGLAPPGAAIRRPLAWAALSGGCLGLAAGLKLTLAPYGAALAFAVLFAGPWRQGLRRLAAYLGAAALAFAIVAGPWMAFLYTHFGSPLFPQFNDAIRSPYADAANFRDERWFPRSWPEWLFFPFDWAFAPSRRISEWAIRDPRLAAVMVAGAAAAAARAWRRRHAAGAPADGRADAPADGPLGRAWRLLWLFLAAGYIAWLLFFSYLRYLAPIELLSGLPIVGAAMLVLRPGRAAGAAAAAAAVAIALGTVYPPWERVPFGQTYLTVTVPEVAPRSLVLVAGKPIAYVIPLMRRDARFVAIANEMVHPGATNRLAQRVRRLIAAQAGPLYLIEFRTDAARNLAILAGYRLARIDAACRPITDKVEHGQARLCPLRRIGAVR